MTSRNNVADKKKASWREFAQGGLIGGVMILSFAAVAKTCIQIDAAPKVADYYNQYRDYRDQYNRLMEWKDRVDAQGLQALLPQNIQNAPAQLQRRIEVAKDLYGGSILNEAMSIGGYEGAAMDKVGTLSRPYWQGAGTGDRTGSGSGLGGAGAGGTGSGLTHNDPQLCFQLEMGAHIGLMAEQGGGNSLASRCDAQGRQELANLSVMPGRDGAGLAPNTAQASEVTRAVMHNEYAMLDVIRGDLAWLRDNQEYHVPYRYPRERFDFDVEEIASHSAALQRVAGIMAGRGFAAYGYEPVRLGRTGLADTEHAAEAANILARLNLAYDGMARYATVYPRIANVRDGLLDVDTSMIDSANEAERYGIGLQLKAMEGVLTTMQVESQQREERLMGAYLAEHIVSQGEGLRGSRP